MKNMNEITIEEAIEMYEKYGITFEINDGRVVSYGIEDEHDTGEKEVPGERM